MSYPMNLQPLVIEDDDDIRDVYKEAFATIAGEFPSGWPFTIAEPCFAFSAEEALKQIAGPKIFHVVILDLGLPEKDNVGCVEGDLDLGLNVLEQCIGREHCPIPALLVISGHIGATDQLKIQDRLRDNFACGRLAAKGDYEQLKSSIRKACHNALRYVGIGLYVREARDREYPPLSPRDEDLIRRSVLGQSGSIGVDLDWWSARRSPELKSPATSLNGWTKVLLGRYLFDQGRGVSRPTFFKLLAGQDSRNVIESVRLVERKLTHIKVTSTVESQSTGLIVTEKVGAQDERPRHLSEIFDVHNTGNPFEVARQIATQVHQLGDLLHDRKALKSLFWEAHDREGLAVQWRRISSQILADAGVPNVNPIELLEEIYSAESKVRLKDRAVVHGDLHLNNVALDRTEHGFEAYIFDPGTGKRSTAGSDLAALEVSVLLHHQLERTALISLCQVLYDPHTLLDTPHVEKLDHSVAQKLANFIRGLREEALTWNSLEVYALLVLDSALIHLGASSFESPGNSTFDPIATGCLAAFAADWYRQFRSEAKPQSSTAGAE